MRDSINPKMVVLVSEGGLELPKHLNYVTIQIMHYFLLESKFVEVG